MSPRTKVLLLIMLLALAAVSVQRLVMTDPESPVSEFTGNTMGTTYSVKIAESPDSFRSETVDSLVAAELEIVDALMSTYDSTSELSRFNSHASTEPFPASAAVLEVFEIATEVSSASGGAFDVTVGPLVNAWGFGPDGPTRRPSDAEITTLSEHVGYPLIRVDRERGALVKIDPGVEADLSGIAKGYGVDRVAEALEGLAITNFLVEVGGELRGEGVRPDGTPWQVAVETPEPEVRRVHARLPLSNAAVATSGDYRNFYVEDGRRLAHIIDPRTGRPAGHAGTSVTVVDETAAKADAWATALSVLGPEAGYDLAVELELAALFILKEGEVLETRPTPALARIVEIRGRGSD